MKDAHNVLVGKPERKRPVGRYQAKMGVNIKWIFSKLGYGSWTGLIWLKIWTGDRLL